MLNYLKCERTQIYSKSTCNMINNPMNEEIKTFIL